VGGSNSVSLNSRRVFMPASLTVLAYTVPTAGGPSVVLAISRTRGLNFGSFSPFARNANTSSIGRSITTVASNRPAMWPPLVDWTWASDAAGSSQGSGRPIRAVVLGQAEDVPAARVDVAVDEREPDALDRLGGPRRARSPSSRRAGRGTPSTPRRAAGAVRRGRVRP